MGSQAKQILVLVGIAAVIAYILVMLGSQNWLGRMGSWPFYKDWILSTFSAFLVLLYFDWVSKKLDREFPWYANWKQRMLRQILLLFILPAGMAILITWLQYTYLYDQNLITHEYFQNEFVVTLLVIGVINLLYFIRFILVNQRDVVLNDDTEDKPSGNDQVVIIGQKGAQKVPVQTDQIAFIKLNSRVVFLTTFANDTLILAENLDYYEQSLPINDFFRANRQFILNRRACRAYESIEHGKIKVELTTDSDSPITISQKKASKFREWIKK